MTKSKALIFALLVSGCAHMTDRARNAADAAAYAAALDKCVTDAEDAFESGSTIPVVQEMYEACAADADKRFGRK